MYIQTHTTAFVTDRRELLISTLTWSPKALTVRQISGHQLISHSHKPQLNVLLAYIFQLELDITGLSILIDFASGSVKIAGPREWLCCAKRFSSCAARTTFGEWLIDRSKFKSNCSSFLFRRIWDLLICVQAHLGEQWCYNRESATRVPVLCCFCFPCQLRPKLYLQHFGQLAGMIACLRQVWFSIPLHVLWWPIHLGTLQSYRCRMTQLALHASWI